MEKYEQCSQEVFDEIKEKAISVWKTFDNSFGYIDEKLERIEQIKNEEADVVFILNMFHQILKKEIIRNLSPEAQAYLKRYDEQVNKRY